MIKLTPISTFIGSESGAITVDWTVLASGMTAMCLATAALMTDNFNMLSGLMDAEMRDRQMRDDWVQYFASHFEDALQSGYLSEEQAEALHDAAATLTNDQLREQLEAGIESLEADTITTEELMELVAIASVSDQRNIVDDATMDHYFGFDGGEPAYMNSSAAQGMYNTEETYTPRTGCNQGNGRGNGQGCVNGGGNG